MTADDPLDDPLERAFAELRAASLRPGPAPLPPEQLPPEQLDALLDADADPAERRRVAAAVVAHRPLREQLAQLLAVDAEIAADVAARAARARFRRLATAVLAVAALLLLALVLWPAAAPMPALQGRIVVAGVDGPKDPTWPPFLRAQRGESLRIADGAANGEPVTWVAVEVRGPGAWSRSGSLSAPLRLAELLTSNPGGPVLLAAGRGDVATITQRLRALCTPPVQAAAALGGAGVARELAAAAAAKPSNPATAATTRPDFLLVVLEIF